MTTRIHTRLEGVRARFDGAAELSLQKHKEAGRRLSERNMREAMAEAAKYVLERGTEGLSEQQAEWFLAAMHRMTAPTQGARATSQSPRAAAERLFKMGTAA